MASEWGKFWINNISISSWRLTPIGRFRGYKLSQKIGKSQESKWIVVFHPFLPSTQRNTTNSTTGTTSPTCGTPPSELVSPSSRDAYSPSCFDVWTVVGTREKWTRTYCSTMRGSVTHVCRGKLLRGFTWKLLTSKWRGIRTCCIRRWTMRDTIDRCGGCFWFDFYIYLYIFFIGFVFLKFTWE